MLEYVSQHQRSKFIGLRPGAEFDALSLAKLTEDMPDVEESAAQVEAMDVVEDALASDFESRLAAFSRLAFTKVSRSLNTHGNQASYLMVEAGGWAGNAL